MAQLRSWESYHIDRKGWRGLAYGWAFGQTGTVYRIRGWNTYGAHSGDVDADHVSNNREVIPILFIGSGHHHDFTAEARAAIVRLRAYHEEVSGRKLYLYGHQELKGIVTSCPGPKGMEYVRANRHLDDATPAPPHNSTPPPPDDQEETMLPLRLKDGWASGPRPHKRADVALLQGLFGLDYGDQQGFYGPKTASDLAEALGRSSPVETFDWPEARAAAARGILVGGSGGVSESHVAAAIRTHAGDPDAHHE